LVGVVAGLVVGELADAVAGVGQDREGAAAIPVDVDGGLWEAAHPGDGAEVAGTQAGVEVVGGHQFDPVAGVEGHRLLLAVGLPAELLADGLGQVAELGAFAESTTVVSSSSTWTAALAGSIA
jgi:hypothetical protein